MEFQNPNEGPALPCLPKYLVSAFDSTQYVSSRKRMVLDWHHLNLVFKRGLVKSVVYVYFLQIKVELIFEGKNLFVLKVLKDSSIWQLGIFCVPPIHTEYICYQTLELGEICHYLIKIKFLTSYALLSAFLANDMNPKNLTF